MATKSRSNEGCWTCRLRRKKCDELRPLCGVCAALEIDCLYSDDKPEWMDGGEKQKERAHRLKEIVKRRAGRRRERRSGYAQDLESDVEGLEVSQVEESDSSVAGMTPTSSGSSAGTVPASFRQATGAGPDESPFFRDEERELHLIGLYLDYVFPFLFPFYRPGLLDAGRGWLLVVLTRNKALMHASLSLASYFFSVALNHTSDGAHDTCKAHNFDELQRQQDLALKELQREMQDLVIRGVKGCLVEGNRVMASIMQLLTYEVAIGNTGNWLMHLDAAAELFRELMTHHARTDVGAPCFTMVLAQLGPFTDTRGYHPWNSDQASLRFFTAYLLFVDVLASTGLEQPPRLQQRHRHLLGEPDEEVKKARPGAGDGPHINMHEFLGIQNWVVVAIGEISALDTWKKEQKRAGSLSMTQLVARATVIERPLRGRISTLDMSADNGPCPPVINDPIDPLVEYSHQAGLLSSPMLKSAGAVSYVWAQAALTYLSVVVSGWQPASTEVRESVSLTLAMLKALPTASCLRTLIWPFTVTGCLAAPEQEQAFRDLVAALGPLQVFGTIKEGLAIMEHVWAHRADVERCEHWDLAACFRCLGHTALLI
ncbi:fungal-specific transcription factor domain-containing protein [Diplogelasinospora grovesii]|uniref:Fungal-specific transcription factor domain-containing protein n=1 Tax=Diplogelasinospora grovesii TaxID=303347 RepID=A0AAN6NJM2_9PEZI|nr:fungal-specific transcription factor domain-containing protein [Diplogelasinospora grovesii]